MPYKVDLHTHSNASPDGGITPAQYRQALTTGLLDYIAVTDHNDVEMALSLRQELGEQIIVGEEIMTTAGEIIGLFLQKAIPANLTPREAVKAISAQDGVVYIPHPFETIRHGLSPASLSEIINFVDIIEVYNGRAYLEDRSTQADKWVKLKGFTPAASSDAHGYKGLGYTFTIVNEPLHRENFVDRLAGADLYHQHPPLRTLFYPKYNRLRKRLGGS